MQWKYLLSFVFLLAVVHPSPARDRHTDWIPPARSIGQGAISVVIDAREPLPEGVLSSLDRELKRIFFGTVTPIDVVTPDLNNHPEFSTEVLVTRVIGACRVDAMPPLHAHKPDTLGRTLVTDGRILPYIELDCRQISGAVRRQLIGKADPERATLLGRALARVLAHEIYHVLGQTHRHSSSGIAAETISSEDLVRDRLDFRFEDFEQMGLVPALGTN